MDKMATFLYAETFKFTVHAVDKYCKSVGANAKVNNNKIIGLKYVFNKFSLVKYFLFFSLFLETILTYHIHR